MNASSSRSLRVQEESWEELASLLKALGHPVRLRIVAGLASGACNVGHIWTCLDLPQPTVSQHLRILRQEGILAAERQGKQVIYRVVDERVPKLLEALGIEVAPLVRPRLGAGGRN